MRRDGPNRLPLPARMPAWRRLVRQLVNFFAVMLWVAAVLAVVAGMAALGAAIVAVILLNAGFAFAQEQRAEHAAESLRRLLPRRCRVLRDGLVLDVDAEELVCDDVVLLDAGDRVSADLIVLEAHAASVDTSALTGESESAPIATGAVLFAGTFLTLGEARGRVTAIGAATRMAGIARLASRPSSPPPLVRELQRVVRTISVIAITIGVAFFAVAGLLGTTWSSSFLFAVGVTVALVPEALLPTVTLALAFGAQRMAQRHALVRGLESVETLGSTTFICMDKTGTLTLNELTAVEVWTPAGLFAVESAGRDPEAAIGDVPPAVRELARVGARASSGYVERRDGAWVVVGDPLDAALDVLARRCGVLPAEERQRQPDRLRYPFDPGLRRMSVVVGEAVFTKGAPDAVLPLCGTFAPAAEAALHEMTGRGLRTIAVATRVAPPGDASRDALERDLMLLGIVGTHDPPRLAARAALASCRTAGIAVAMVTGDHPRTAVAVARETGLVVGEERVVTGDQLPADPTALGALLDHDGIVLARIAPEDKFRIAQALRGRGHVLAMTGDGVNDAPALREADIGVAMGRSGTDVAREAADLVLLDDDFATIIAAIECGRGVYANVRRFLTYHLTDNVAELTPFLIWALSGSTIPLAIGVLQVLALDIVTDTLPATALGAELPAAGILDGPPDRGRLLDRTVALRAFGVLGPVEAFVSFAAFLATFAAAGWRPGDDFPEGWLLLAASGAAFAAVVLGQFANAFACRSAVLRPGQLGWRSNRLLLWAVLVAGALVVGTFAVEPIAAALGQARPTAAGFALALMAPPAVLAADAAYKALHSRRSRSAQPVHPHPSTPTEASSWTPPATPIA